MKKILLFMAYMLTLSASSQAHVNLLNPTGGESYMAGDLVTIQWQIAISHTLLNWDLRLSTDGGDTYETIQLNIPSTGNAVGTQVSYEWVVPETATDQARIWIYMDNQATDYEDISPIFTIQSAVGIAEINKLDQSILYPNPIGVSNELYLSLPIDRPDQLNIIIFDVVGKPVHTEKFYSINLLDDIRINIDGIKAGQFTLLILNNQSAIIGNKSFVVIN